MADEIPNNDSIFKKIGSVISTTLDAYTDETDKRVNNNLDILTKKVITDDLHRILNTRIL